MVRTLALSLLCIGTSTFAGEPDCSRLTAQVDGPEGNFRPPLEAKVIGNGRLQFYSAPNANCRMKGIFVVKGDTLTVYKPYGNWLNVMFVSKEGDDFIGWVSGNRVEIMGQYGRNQ